MVEKPLSAFSKHKLGRYGLRPRCRECSASEGVAYRSRTVEHRAEYNARWKREHPENHRIYNAAWIERNPEKTAAHSAVRRAVERGDLVRPASCQDCGVIGAVHAHHPDHSKLLDVEWLCPRCHAGRGVITHV